MKKFFSLALAFLLTFGFSKAQFVLHTASDNVETARAKADSALNSPRLVSLGTVNGTIPGLEFGGSSIPLQFKTSGSDKGKASAWAYFFNSEAEPDSVRAIIVADAGILGKIVLDATAYGLDLSALSAFVPNASLDGANWIDSDSMTSVLLAAPDYLGFFENHSDATVKYAALGYYPLPFLDPARPYWSVMLKSETDDDSVYVFIDGLNGTPASVEKELDNSDVRLFPNPSGEILTIEGIKGEAEAAIYSLNGILEKNLGKISRSARINVGFLNSGTYFLVLRSRGVAIVKKFSKIRR